MSIKPYSTDPQVVDDFGIQPFPSVLDFFGFLELLITVAVDGEVGEGCSVGFDDANHSGGGVGWRLGHHAQLSLQHRHITKAYIRRHKQRSRYFLDSLVKRDGTTTVAVPRLKTRFVARPIFLA